MSTCISKRGEFNSHEFVRSGDIVVCEDCGYAVPEPRSTPRPSTGTPEPSQAASEAPGALDGATEPPPEYAWPATPGEFAALWNEADDERRARMVARLVENGEAAVRCFTLNHDGAVAELRHSTGEVARLREALEQVRALWCPLCGTSPAGSDPECSWCERLAAVLASVDAPAPDEADEPECACYVTPESTWLSAASCGYGSGYEPGSQMEWNPDCPLHPDTPAAPAVPAEGDEAGRGFRQAVAEVLPMLVRVNGRCQACSEPVSEDAWPSHAADAIAELLPLAAVSPAPAPDESR